MNHQLTLLLQQAAVAFLVRLYLALFQSQNPFVVADTVKIKLDFAQ